MVVAELLAKFGFQVDEKSAKKAQGQLDGLRKNILRVASVFAAGSVVRGLVNMSKEIATLADDVDTVASKLGVGAAELQKFQFAAHMTDVDIGTANKSLQMLAINMNKANSGTGEAADIFKKLGVSVKDGNGNLRSTLDVATDVAGAIQGTSSATEKLAMTTAVFGSRAGGLVNTLALGKEGLNGMFQEADRLGVVFDKELIAASVRWDDAQKKAAYSTRALKAIVARELLPTLADMDEEYSDFIANNREAIRTDIAPFLRRLAEAFGRARFAVAQIAIGFVKFVKGLDPAQKKLLAIGAAVLALIAAFSSPFLALVVLAGLIFLILDDIGAYMKGQDSQLGELISRWQELIDVLSAAPSMNDWWLIKYLRFAKNIADGIVEAFRIFTSGFALEMQGVVNQKKNAKGFIESQKQINEANARRMEAAGDIAGAARLRAVNATTAGSGSNVTINQTINGAGDPMAVGEASSRAFMRDFQMVPAGLSP